MSINNNSAEPSSGSRTEPAGELPTHAELQLLIWRAEAHAEPEALDAAQLVLEDYAWRLSRGGAVAEGPEVTNIKRRLYGALAGSEDELAIAEMAKRLGDKTFHDTRVDRAADRIRIRQEAQALVDSENQLTPDYPPLKTVQERMDEGVPEPKHRIQGLAFEKSTIMVVGQPKVGKTTLALGLCRSLITGESFLGNFATNAIPGNICYLNYEVSEALHHRWLREGQVPANRILSWPLRGHPSPFTNDTGRELLIDGLKAYNCSILIVDPLANAFGGTLDPNDNGAVQAFLQTIEEVAEQAAINGKFIFAHAGWGPDGRARGASALAGHPDATWTITADDDRNRYFKAEGRDILLPETRLLFDISTRSLTLDSESQGRTADAEVKRIHAKTQERKNSVLNLLRSHAPEGVSLNKIKTECRMSYDIAKATVTHLKEVEGVVYETAGKNRSRLFHLLQDNPAGQPNDPTRTGLFSCPPPKGGEDERTTQPGVQLSSEKKEQDNPQDNPTGQPSDAAAEIPAALAGPCANCDQTTEKYGDHGGPLCPDCQPDRGGGHTASNTTT